MSLKVVQTVEYTKYDGDFTRAKERLIRETAMEIRLNGKTVTTAMVSPTMLKEFVIGNLFTRGLISGIKEMKSINIERNAAEVVTTGEKAASVMPATGRSDFRVSAAEIFQAVRAILRSRLFAETEAVHSAGLFQRGGGMVAIAEDIGRHNALDKVIGAGLLQEIDFGQTLAASTGRQPAEMMHRLRRAGIPIIATKGVPTSLALEIAEASGITIAGLVRGETMIVYTHPSRIIVP